MSLLRLVPVAALVAAPLAAQNPSRHTLRGTDLALYNLAGTLTIEAGTGDAAAVDVARGGADSAQLRIVEGALDGRNTLRVVYPGSRIRYSRMSDGSTELRVRDDGTFGDDDHDRGGRRVWISSRGDGIEAWADLRVAVPPGRMLAVHLAVGKLTVTNVEGRLQLEAANAPVTVNGTRGTLAVEVGAGDVRLTGTDGEVKVSTGSGRVELTKAKGGAVAIETGSGDVAASGLEAGNLAIESGSGNVTVEIKGEVDRLYVDTGSGDIAITAPPSLSAQLELETASGEINSDFPLSVTQTGSDHLSGTVGGGKGKISVETGSGGVRLLRARS